MDQAFDRKTFRDRRSTVVRAALLAGAALLASCGSSKSDKNASTTTRVAAATSLPAASTTTENTGASSTTEAGATKPLLTFDYLGGNSKVIRVYPTPNSPGTDFNGTFYDGDQVGADCKTNGHLVTSAPGELPRSSNQWIRIFGSPGVKQYSTAVYVKKPDQLLAELDICKNL